MCVYTFIWFLYGNHNGMTMGIVPWNRRGSCSDLLCPKLGCRFPWQNRADRDLSRNSQIKQPFCIPVSQKKTNKCKSARFAKWVSCQWSVYSFYHIVEPWKRDAKKFYWKKRTYFSIVIAICSWDDKLINCVTSRLPRYRYMATQSQFLYHRMSIIIHVYHL